MDMLDELDDDDREGPTTLPRACLQKALKDVAPDMKFANETRDFISLCASEFVNVVSVRASELCTAQAKKTMTNSHVMEALEALGLAMFKDEQICELQERHLEAHKKRRQSSKLENLGIPEEELLRKQEELFRSAREQAERLEREEFAALQAQLAAEEQRAAGLGAAAGCSGPIGAGDSAFASAAVHVPQRSDAAGDDENYDE